LRRPTDRPRRPVYRSAAGHIVVRSESRAQRRPREDPSSHRGRQNRPQLESEITSAADSTRALRMELHQARAEAARADGVVAASVSDTAAAFVAQMAAAVTVQADALKLRDEALALKDDALATADAVVGAMRADHQRDLYTRHEECQASRAVSFFL
jgi:hypothetical protein